MSERSERISTPLDDRRREMRRVADALRSVIHKLVATEAPLEVFDGVAEELEKVAARLAAYPQGHSYIGFAEAANAFDSDASHDNSPMMGRANPLAPPLELVFGDDEVVGRATCGAAYEGPPGYVHGGYVAAMFDELLGAAQTLSGRPGMTGRLTVSYRSPTPLNQPLQLRGTVSSASGRKIRCAGTIHHGDTLCAEAEGLFISIDERKFEAMRDARDAAVTEAAGGSA